MKEYTVHCSLCNREMKRNIVLKKMVCFICMTEKQRLFQKERRRKTVNTTVNISLDKA